jgi:hypothetical protein
VHESNPKIPRETKTRLQILHIHAHKHTLLYRCMHMCVGSDVSCVLLTVVTPSDLMCRVCGSQSLLHGRGLVRSVRRIRLIPMNCWRR